MRGVLVATSAIVVALSFAGCPKSSQKGGPGLPHPMFTAMPDFVGFTTALDGSASSDPANRPLTYQWHFSSVPQGSTLTDASFASGSAVMTTFMPDVGGVYDVTLIATAAGGALNQVTKSVSVPTVPIFFAAGDGNAQVSAFSVSMIRSDGTGARVLSCPNSFDLGVADNTTGKFPPQIEFLISGLGNFRTWDGPAPLVVFPVIGVGTLTSSFTSQLMVGNDQTSCSGRAPLRVDVSASLGAADWTFFFPRFSPDGKRIVALALGSTSGASTFKLITVGVDGSSFRAVRNFPTSNDQLVAPAWADATHVAWIENVGTASPPEFKILQAADADNAGDTAATQIMDCPSGTPFGALNQFAFADPMTMIFAAAPIASSGNTPGLVALYREAVGGTCSAAAKLTGETTAGHFSGDFTISPDGKTVLYASTSGSAAATIQGGQLTDIFTVPVDGSAPPTRIAGDPMLIDTSPRYIANGRQIVWTQLGAITFDAGAGSGSNPPSTASILMANADGTGVRTLVSNMAKPGEVHYALSGGSLGNSCAVGGNGASAGAIAALAFVLVLAFARRRRA